jgi:hypothetical protein
MYSLRHSKKSGQGLATPLRRHQTFQRSAYGKVQGKIGYIPKSINDV